MTIKWVEDLGAPLAVVGIDLTVETVAPGWNEWASYAVVAAGYVGDLMGIGPRNNQFIKNMAIAATPWAAKNLYNRIRGGTSPVTRLSRWPAPLVEQPFNNARLV